NVRSSAALQLGELQARRALDALIELLQRETDLAVREDVTWALARLGDDALEPLIGLLRHDDRPVRHHAAHALGKLGHRRAVDGLLDALADEDPAVVAKAALALGQIGDEQAIPALVSLLAHEHDGVRETAMSVLERFDRAALPALIGALSDERAQV